MNFEPFLLENLIQFRETCLRKILATAGIISHSLKLVQFSFQPGHQMSLMEGRQKMIISVDSHQNRVSGSTQRELFLSEVNNMETISAIDMNNDTYCLQKRIEKFPLLSCW